MYEKAIVLGRGKTALGVVSSLLGRGIRPEAYCVGAAVGPMQGQLERLLGREAAEGFFREKEEMTQILLGETKRTLLISAVNSYLLPKQVLEKENITAVNFHNAYLPRHPGRNAEAWAIFEEDPFAGVTWHYITPQVDAGRILVQGKIPITETTTSFSLLAQQNALAMKLFEEIFPGVWEGTLPGTPQEKSSEKLHYSWERPNGGRLELSWGPKKISAFLRAYDYGILNTLGSPVVEIGGQTYRWKKAAVAPDPQNREEISVSEEQQEIRIYKGGTVFLFTHIEKIQKEGT